MRSINYVLGGLVCWALAACSVTDPSVASSKSEVIEGSDPGNTTGACASNAACARGTGCYQGTCLDIVEFSPKPAPPLSPPCVTQSQCTPVARSCSVNFETYTPGGTYGYCI